MPVIHEWKHKILRAALSSKCASDQFLLLQRPFSFLTREVREANGKVLHTEKCKKEKSLA